MKSKSHLIIIILSLILSFIFISKFFNEPQNFEEFALGAETSSSFALKNSIPIHLDRLTKERHDNLIKGWQLRGKKEVIFCLGNSQTHGINQMKNGESTYNDLLFDEFASQDLNVLTHSIPNANLQEFYLLFSYWTTQVPIKYLTLPVFMDDLRETGIRQIYMPLLSEIGFQLSSEEGIDQKINSQLSQQLLTSDESQDMLGIKETVQEKTEKYLNNELGDHFTSWNYRPQIRGQLFTNLYILRNTLLGIDAQTKRKMISSRMNENMAALNALLKLAANKGIKVVLYIPPIRQDVEIPYELKEYELFKATIEKVSSDFPGIYFYNLEDIVPGEYWGMKDATNLSGKPEYDFMHFQFEGHRNLANALIPKLQSIIN